MTYMHEDNKQMTTDMTRVATEQADTMQDHTLLEESKIFSKTKSKFLNYIGNITQIEEKSFAVSDASQLFEDFGQGHGITSHRVSEHALTRT